MGCESFYLIVLDNHIMSTYYPNEIQFEDFHTLPSREQKGGKSTSLLYNGGKLFIETPWAVAPFGVQDFEYLGQSSKHSLNIQVKDLVMLDFLKTMDQYLLQFSEGRELFPTLRPDYKDPTRSPTLRMKIQTHGRLKVDCFVGQVRVNWDIEQLKRQIYPGREIQCVIQLMPIWYNSEKFGISFKLHKLRIQGELDESFYHIV